MTAASCSLPEAAANDTMPCQVQGLPRFPTLVLRAGLKQMTNKDLAYCIVFFTYVFGINIHVLKTSAAYAYCIGKRQAQLR